jgi:hypothetical protein
VSKLLASAFQTGQRAALCLDFVFSLKYAAEYRESAVHFVRANPLRNNQASGDSGMKLRSIAPLFSVILLIAASSVMSMGQDARMPVPIGTKLDITLNTPLSTQFSQAGDRFTADVSDGPYKDAIVHGTVRSVSQSGHFKGSAELLLSFDNLVMRDGRRSNMLAEVTRVFVQGDKVGNEGTIESSGQGKYTWIRAGLGSALGAAIGGIAGGGEGAAIGAAAGGGAGAASKVASKKQQVVLQSGTMLTISVFSN